MCVPLALEIVRKVSAIPSGRTGKSSGFGSVYWEYAFWSYGSFSGIGERRSGVGVVARRRSKLLSRSGLRARCSGGVMVTETYARPLGDASRSCVNVCRISFARSVKFRSSVPCIYRFRSSKSTTLSYSTCLSFSRAAIWSYRSLTIVFSWLLSLRKSA
jgi:hypothetical protein